MRKIIFIAMLSVAAISVFAQNNTQFKKRPAIGIAFVLQDFPTAASIKSSGLGPTLAGTAWKKTRNMNPGIALSYHDGINDYLDYTVRLTGSFLNYPNTLVNNNLSFGQDRLLLEGDAGVQLKLLSDKYAVTPYLHAGLGVSKYKGYYGAIAPLGAGLQINLYDETFIFTNLQFRQAISENVTSHMWYSLGVAGNIGKPKPLFEALPIPTDLPTKDLSADSDADGDGIMDSKDNCKDVIGTAKYNGCPVPDTDGDGVDDENDKCKNQAGTAKYNGCPVPDTDGDGIDDDNDKCKDVAGTAKYNGCPVPDRDNDGVEDDIDKCADEAGTADNNGCPKVADEIIEKVKFAAQKIYFDPGKSILLATSNKSLNSVVEILKANPDLMLDIEGHTDNTGVAEKNQVLSQKRAEAVLNFFKGKGISEDRLVATGYGADQPIAGNETADGRKQNRRVELKVKNN
jgi:OmpA-OmpF porin, OOP family